jgi:hypothetical protein
MSSARTSCEIAWRLDPRTGRLIVMSAEDNHRQRRERPGRAKPEHLERLAGNRGLGREPLKNFRLTWNPRKWDLVRSAKIGE